MPKPKIAILGAGLAGLSAAYHLKKGYSIFEKEKEAGGLCRSYNINGFTFDYDGHLLHFRKKNTYSFVKSLLGNNIKPHYRNSFIRYMGEDLPYPFQANFMKLPRDIANECLNGLKNAKNGHSRDYPNFRLWVHAAFGEGIAKHFMLPYNNKFWTIPCEELTCGWFDGFIPVVGFKDIIKNPAKHFSSIGYNSIFYYPKEGGINSLVKALKENLKEKINYCSEITSIDVINKELIINKKRRLGWDKLIYSIALPETQNLIKNLPLEIKHAANLLNYNSILVFNIAINKQIARDRHWIYFPEKKYNYFRVGFYNSFSGNLSPKGCSSIYVEHSYPKDKHIDTQEIKRETLAELIKEKIIPSEKDILSCSVIDIKYGYPIYDQNYNYAVTKIKDFLLKNQIYPVGRYGGWKYMTMEDVLLDGKNTAYDLA